MLVGQLPDHAGRGEQGVGRDRLTAAAGVLDQFVPQRGEADPVGLQYLGQRHALVGATAAGLRRGGQVEGGLRVPDGGDDEPQVVRDGAVQVLGRDEVVAVERDAVEDRGVGVVDQPGQPGLGPRGQAGAGHPAATSGVRTGHEIMNRMPPGAVLNHRSCQTGGSWRCA